MVYFLSLPCPWQARVPTKTSMTIYTEHPGIMKGLIRPFLGMQVADLRGLGVGWRPAGRVWAGGGRKEVLVISLGAGLTC